MTTGQPLGFPLSHPRTVWALAFSPQGRLLLTGCEDANARLFLAATGAQIGAPLPHEGNVRAVAFSRDGATALTGSAGGARYAAARLWDIAPETSFAPHLLQGGGDLMALALSPDGRTLLTGADDGTARLWDLSTRRVIEPVMPHDDKVSVVAFGHDGQMYLTGDDRGVVRLWDRANRARPRHLLRTAGWIASAAVAPDDRTALIGVAATGLAGSGKKALLWETATGNVLGDPLPHSGSAFAVAISPDGRTLATGDEKGVQLWEGATRRRLGERMGGSWAIPIAFFPDGKSILLVRQGIVQVWDIQTGRVTGPPPYHPEGGIRRVALSPDGRSILISGPGRIARLWDVVTGKTLGSPVILDGASPVASCAWSDNGCGGLGWENRCLECARAAGRGSGAHPNLG